MMTPMAQQSTGRPYRCRPTTSGAKKKKWSSAGQYQAWPHIAASPLPQSLSMKAVPPTIPVPSLLAQILRGSTGLLDKAVL